MDHVTLGTSVGYVAWSYVSLGTMLLDHILPLASPIHPQNPIKF